MASILDRPVSEIAGAVRSGNTTARALAEESLSRIRSTDESLHAFLSIWDEEALRRADLVDEIIARGEDPGLLAGVPVAVKDNMCTKGFETTAASKILAGFKPPYDATVVSRLYEAGAVIVGKTNLDEFAMGSSTENSAMETTRNPWDIARVPGGSSGGSAATVAAGAVPFSLGSDTGGSIRQPASLCGIVGLKPTYGMISRYGLLAFASSLDQIGPFGRNVADCAVALDALSGVDDMDTTSSVMEAQSFVEGLDDLDAKTLTIGIPAETMGEAMGADVRPVVEGAIARLENAGATVKTVHLPLTPHMIAVYYLLSTAEASSNLGRYDGVHYGHRAEGTDDIIELFSRSRDEGFGEEVKRRIILGTFVLSAGHYDAYYLKASRVRTLIRKEAEEALKEVDVLVGPTSPVPAFPLGERIDDPLLMYSCDVFTVGANLAGFPAISVPCGFTSDGLPVGMHVMAGPYEDRKILRVARLIESLRTIEDNARRPAVWAGSSE